MPERYVCPVCGTKTMEKKKDDDGTYVLVCSVCGKTRGPIPPDKRKAVR